MAQRIRAKLLRVLEREVDALPESIGTEMHQDVANLSYEKDKNGNPIKNGKLTKRTDGGKRYKLTDLTRAYKDLTDDLPKAQEEIDEPLLELFRRMDEDA